MSHAQLQSFLKIEQLDSWLFRKSGPPLSHADLHPLYFGIWQSTPMNGNATWLGLSQRGQVCRDQPFLGLCQNCGDPRVDGGLQVRSIDQHMFHTVGAPYFEIV